MTCFFVPTTHDKINNFISVESLFPVHNAQGSESPVDRIQAQMSGHVVDKIVFVLFSLQSKKCEKIGNFLVVDGHLPGTGCKTHVGPRAELKPSSPAIFAMRGGATESNQGNVSRGSLGPPTINIT